MDQRVGRHNSWILRSGPRGSTRATHARVVESFDYDYFKVWTLVQERRYIMLLIVWNAYRLSQVDIIWDTPERTCLLF
jgi:hypothetical protein